MIAQCQVSTIAEIILSSVENTRITKSFSFNEWIYYFISSFFVASVIAYQLF